MTMFEEPICCMVIAPLSPAELDGIAEVQYRKTFPYATQKHFWTIAPGPGSSALISRLAGSEGSDWTLAEIASRRVGSEPVYSLWFDPDRSIIVEWRDGRRIREHAESPETFAASLGFQIEPPDVPSIPASQRSVAVVEDASIADVRSALGDQAKESSLSIRKNKVGAIVSATDGQVSESWDLSETLPDATIYHLQRDFEPEEFTVLILKRGDVVASFRIPSFDSDMSVPDIKGASTIEDILKVLDVTPSLLAFDR